ncbi:transposase [Streptomyces sp. NPDC057690]|uniref:transposase n=1 Tax=Streptomyces sp. NPDC057690 TaxID=3346214 RepID=UPI00367E2652
MAYPSIDLARLGAPARSHTASIAQLKSVASATSSGRGRASAPAGRVLRCGRDATARPWRALRPVRRVRLPTPPDLALPRPNVRVSSGSTLLDRFPAPAALGEIDWDVSVDSTIMRAHQHAAGAHTDPPPAPCLKGGRADRTSGRNRVAEPARPPGGGGGGGEGPGRSRGGFTTKLHLSTDGRCRPLSLIVTPVQRADCTQFKPVLEKIRVPKPGPGRPRKKPDSVAADKACSNAMPRVPAASQHPAHHRGEDRQPGRPPAQRLTRRTATQLRRRALQETQHHRAGHQPAKAAPGSRHPL